MTESAGNRAGTARVPNRQRSIEVQCNPLITGRSQVQILPLAPTKDKDMSKISITPKYKDIPRRERPEGYYVYLHRRATDGSVFYVGKGRKDRGWHISRQYNRRWMGNARKYGCVVEIVDDSMSEDQAFELECNLIEEYGLDNLANMTTGGDGSSGVVSSRRKEVCCSNGMKFESMHEAVDWLRANGHPKASVGTISACCSGRVRSSCGMAFELECNLIEEYGLDNLANMTTGGDGSSGVVSSRRKEVCCSNGMKFESMHEAVDWLRANGHPKASVGTISACCSGRVRSSCGMAWWIADGGMQYDYQDPGLLKSQSYGRPVIRSDGKTYKSSKIAALDLRETGKALATSSAIRLCCSGKIGSAYGFDWKYAGSNKVLLYIEPSKKISESKKVAVIRSDGVEFSSAKDASLIMGFPRASANISACCHKKRKKALGYGWRFK